MLLQVGKFYEAVGLDALLLNEYGGLNMMGDNLEVPRAGCPEDNILQVLDDLVGKAGLSVVSWKVASRMYLVTRCTEQHMRVFGFGCVCV
jgi:DNA mismatch repair ATPase MutS